VVQNLERALGRDKRRRLLLTLNGWAVARANEENGFGVLANGCELFVTFGQR
jgi:hypothetical protein